MRDLQREPDFGEEPFEAIGVGLDVARQELQRDGLAELQVVGAIDLAHAASAQQPDHPVPIGQDLAGHEALRFAGKARRRG